MQLQWWENSAAVNDVPSSDSNVIVAILQCSAGSLQLHCSVVQDEDTASVESIQLQWWENSNVIEVILHHTADTALQKCV